MLLHRIVIVEVTVNSCCDFIAQCTLVRINHCTYHPFYSFKSSKIYRCWIVWGKNIRVVIVPSFLAIAYIGQKIYLHLISRSQFIASSYLDSDKWCINNYRWPKFCGPVGTNAGSNRFGCIHGCECPGDGLDRVQDPEGGLSS